MTPSPTEDLLSVPHVFRLADPFKVLSSVISLDSVFVVHLVFTERGFSEKRAGHRSVYVDGDNSFVKVYLYGEVPIRRLRELTVYTDLRVFPGAAATNISLVTDFVEPVEPRSWYPYLFCVVCVFHGVYYTI